jgi:hypothetical protein
MMIARAGQADRRTPFWRGWYLPEIDFDWRPAPLKNEFTRKLRSCIILNNWFIGYLKTGKFKELLKLKEQLLDFLKQGNLRNGTLLRGPGKVG